MIEVEKYGIEPIPRAERRGTGRDLWIVQTGMAFSFPTLVIGLMLVPGLSWRESILVNLLANVILASLVAVMGYYGVDHGIPAGVSARFTFGYPLGSQLCSILLLVSIIGWYAVTNELAGVALDGVIQSATGFSSPILIILLVGVANLVPALLGFENLKLTSLIASLALVYLSVWIIVAAWSKQGYAQITHFVPSGEPGISTSIDWIISSFVVGVFLASDYSRHISSRAGNWWGAMLGVAPPSILLTAAGVFAKLATAKQDPVDAIRALGLGIPGLLLVIVSTVPSCETSIYSGGLVATNLFPGSPRWVNTVIVGGIGILIAALRVTQHFGAFLDTLAYIFSPIVGVSLSDYFLVRRCRLPIENSAERTPASAALPAVISIAVGMGIGYLCSPHIPVSISSLAGAFGAYYLLFRLKQPALLEQL